MRLLIILMTFYVSTANAGMYKCKDVNGNTTYSQTRCQGNVDSFKTDKESQVSISRQAKTNNISIHKSEGYKDTQGYKDYLKLPNSYKSPAMEAIFKNGYEAEQRVKNLPSSKGGTIGQFLDKKASIPAVEDLGWITAPYQGGFQVERFMLLGELKLIYRWHVSSNGIVKATNGKAIGITK